MYTDPGHPLGGPARLTGHVLDLAGGGSGGRVRRIAVSARRTLLRQVLCRTHKQRSIVSRGQRSTEVNTCHGGKITETGMSCCTVTD